MFVVGWCFTDVPYFCLGLVSSSYSIERIADGDVLMLRNISLACASLFSSRERQDNGRRLETDQGHYTSHTGFVSGADRRVCTCEVFFSFV